MGKIFDWLDTQFGLKAPHKRFLKRRLPKKLSYYYCLGGAALTSYIILAFTGMLLSLYYIPSASEAYDSIIRIQKDVRLGWLIRGLHGWSATLLIIFILLHTLRVFITRSYQPPRQLNWIVGSMSMLLAFMSGFTGYLLPWDKKAYWATEVGTSMITTVPFIGRSLMALIRGGLEIDGSTLIRFYSIHVLWTPVAMFTILWLHFHMIKRQGVKGGI